MLVLTRKQDQVIRIGDDITITVVEIRGDKVRLGIEASTDIPVLRQEVYEAIQRQAESKEEQCDNCKRMAADCRLVSDGTDSGESDFLCSSCRGETPNV